jgi:hypothetical protein
MTQGQSLLQGIAAGINAVLQSLADELEQGRLAALELERSRAENAELFRKIEALETGKTTENPGTTGTKRRKSLRNSGR